MAKELEISMATNISTKMFYYKKATNYWCWWCQGVSWHDSTKQHTNSMLVLETLLQDKVS